MNYEDLRVLVIDDEIGIRKSLSIFLEDEGFSVNAVSSGKEALMLNDLNSYNAAIVDIRMPELSGDQLIIKLNEKNNRLKFIIYTGSQEFDIPLELQNIGIERENIFYKPLENLSLISELLLKLCL